MSTRVTWLGFCVVIAVAMWSRRASAQGTVEMTPDLIDVGGVLIGQTGSATGMLDDTNNNDRVDIVIDPACPNPERGTFTITPNTNIDLTQSGSGGIATITVQYTAAMRGIRQCTVYVYETGTTNLEETFSVRGTGQTPANITVADPPNFGAIRFNDAAPGSAVARTITVQNTGDRTLDISNVQIGGTNAADFTRTTGGTTASIPGGGQASWTVTFNPDGPTGGARSATMTFTSNDPDEGTKTINLAGTATTATISVTSPDPFGQVSIGSSKTVDIVIANTAAANKGPLGVRTGSIAVTNPAGAASWFTFAACPTNPAGCDFSPDIAVTTQNAIGVRCTPPDDAGTSTQMATLSFDSDSDTAGGNSVTVSCTAGSSNLVANAAAFDFGPLLVGVTSAGMQFTVTNTGNETTNVHLNRTGLNKDHYDATATLGGVACGASAVAPCAMPPASVITVTVTFAPGVENELSAGLDLISSGGGNRSVTLNGKGVDRHILLPGPLVFPDTYRNPGSMAMPLSVTIQNTGEAPLQIENLEIIGDGTIWSLAEPFAPFAVPGLSSHDVLVKFTPLAADKAPDAQLEITCDDRVNPISVLMLSGNGKDRNVDMVPGSIDIGETFAGIPARLSITRPGDIVTVINSDVTTFNVRDLKIEGGDAGAFVVQDLSGNSFSSIDIAPGPDNLLQFDIVFSPSHPGEFTSTLVLYLDEDPTAQKPVPIRGNALYVNAHGSGGCSTSGRPGTAMLLVVGLVLVWRRRR